MATNFTDKSISSIQLKDEKYHIKSVPFHATEEEWNSTLASYVPKQAEIVVYDADENFDLQRIKIGDGITPVGNLEFAGGAQADWNASEGEPGHVLNRTHWVDADGTVHKMDKMFLPECIDGGALFGTTEKQIEILPETNIQFYHNGADYNSKRTFENMPNDVDLPFPELSYGKYIVCWNGISYECAVQCANGSNPDGSVWKRTTLGNVAGLKNTEFAGINMGIDSGEPFLIDTFFVYTTAGTISYITFYRFDDNISDGYIPVHISLYETAINKMPTKYLPDGVPCCIEGSATDTLTFDGNIEGREVLDLGEGMYFVKVSDAFVEGAELNGGTLTYVGLAEGAPNETLTITEDMIVDVSSAFGFPAYVVGEYIYIMSQDLTQDGMTLGKGIHFMCAPDEFYVSELKAPSAVIVSPGIVRKLSTECLPDGVPYCIDGGRVTVLSNADVSREDDNEDGIDDMLLINTELDLVAGETYIVNWNGTEYSCVAVDLSALAGMSPYIALGDVYTMSDGEIGDASTGEPFVIMYAPTMDVDAGITGMVGPLSGDLPDIVEIYKDDIAIRKLDNRCLDLEWIPEAKEKYLIQEQTVTVQGMDGIDSVYTADLKIESELNFKIGDNVPLIIKINGTEYSAKGSADSDADYIISEPGYNFIGYSSTAWVFWTTNPGTYTVAVIDPAQTTYSKLPEKFLPDSTATKEYVDEAINKIEHPTPPVTSVNGKTGVVNLTATDVGALPDTTVIPSIVGLASEEYVDNKVASMVDSAPETLNTLNELAAALGDDPNFATTIATQIGEKASSADLTAHISNTSNPHGVTAEQIGAATTSYVDTAVGAVPKVVVDSALSNTSTNPVQNKVIKTALDKKPGEIVTGKIYTINGESVTAGTGAEVFNDLEFNIASGDYSHAEGNFTIASGIYQHVQGKYNIEDTSHKYAHIVGNGDTKARSNAHTLDWNGNAWYAGTVETKAIILNSSTPSSTKKFKITVDDTGTLTVTEL